MAKTIKMLSPEAGRTDTAGLRAFDADALARCAADAAQPWWRRQSCAEALAGRVPERRVPELIARVQDTGDVSHVRIALLDLLADRPELLPWLRHEDRQQDGAYGMAEAVLGARGALGDLTAAGALAALAFSPWHHRRKTGEAGLDALAARCGAEAVLAELDGARPEERSDPRWRIEAVCTQPPPASDPAERLLRATAALTAAGLAPRPPVSCGEDNGSGDGTYHVIGYGTSDSTVFISTLGRFATGDDDDPDVRRALESAGFRWIDRAVGSTEVTGLCVYYFGSRDPLKVDTLLFYWQD
ncbi:hypothetical protein ACFVT6_18680 [Streptomyces sp. NPDC058049]|uniref:hypothetical protein n=1 Tax=Streptomyces sp. NPDC058049 TaxID=3346314 RepID=UPI0036E0A8F4